MRSRTDRGWGLAEGAGREGRQRSAVMTSEALKSLGGGGKDRRRPMADSAAGKGMQSPTKGRSRTWGPECLKTDGERTSVGRRLAAF